ncbi:putative diguanylate cyclase YegE [Roseovarius tolerans]|uniref:Putative diguanylate cyclase YegE n=1 Tax=Roseovarius tolerans TaxID=74031 RepID=A0A0L6CUA5_9RHOB|nr:putative diguanylate cyclase YegE [Roseovarius tolerans]
MSRVSHEAFLAVLDRICPMHAVLAPTGHIVQAGPTLAKVIMPRAVTGTRFLDLFELVRPARVHDMTGLLALDGARLRLRLRAGPRHAFKGVLAPLDMAGERGALVNLSFGISVIEAVRDFGLTGADFAATDLATEMLYMLEAKSAAMEESRKLNLRLEGARIAAQEQAFTDTLTGLKNRRALDHILDRMVQGGEDFALMHLDLDYFKRVNDTHGHAAGDHVLQVVARRMLSLIRPSDVIARVGGDEFILLFVGSNARDWLADVAHRLIRRLEEPVEHDGRICRISASIGATLRSLYDHADIARMLADSDQALYAAKEAGRGCYVIHPPGPETRTTLRDVG